MDKISDVTKPNTCPCEDRYYDDGDISCEPCHISWFVLIIFLYNFSDSCDGIDDDDCLTCNTTDTFRLDYHAINKTCPCDVGYFHNNVEICV